MIIGLNVRATTIKLLEENIGENHSNLGLENFFLIRTLKAQVWK